MPKANKTNKKRNVTGKGAAIGPKGGGRNRGGGERAVDMSMARNWLELLRDPCTSQLARPCYTGTDAGYLLRTVDIWTPSKDGTFVGGNSTRDVVIQVCPYNFSFTSGAKVANVAVGESSIEFDDKGFENFICSSAVVRRYRPVAACLKWVPTGIYSNRAGAVGLAYTPGQVYPSVGIDTVDNAFAACQHTTGMGMETHEVRWLPTQTDETFTSTDAGDNASAGCMQLVLKGVNCINTTTRSVLNGYVEISVVWEWVPVADRSVSMQVSAPPPYTSQSVLSNIKDMGSFLFRGVITGANNYGKIANAIKPYVGLFSSGVGSSAYRGSSMGVMM